MKRFGTGFLPDTKLFPKDLASYVHHRDLIGAPLGSNLPAQIVNSIYIPMTGGIRNQAQGDACTGFAFAESFDMAQVRQGIAASSVSSARAMYRGGRRYGNQREGLPPTAGIQDAGCAPSYVIAAALQDGVPTEASDPYDASQLVDDQQTLAAAVDGVPRAPMVVQAYSPIVEPAGPELTLAVQQALLSGTVELALQSSAMQTADGSVVLTAPPPGPVDHMVVVADVYTVTFVSSAGSGATLSNGITMPFQRLPATGDVVFGVRGSWGPQGSPACPIMPGMVLIDSTYLSATSFQYMVRIAAAGAKR